MRTTVFELESGEVAAKVQDEPAWQWFEEYDGRDLDYRASELYVVLPETLHDWRDLEVDTLLSVCLVRQSR